MSKVIKGAKTPFVFSARRFPALKDGAIYSFDSKKENRALDLFSLGISFNSSGLYAGDIWYQKSAKPFRALLNHG